MVFAAIPAARITSSLLLAAMHGHPFSNVDPQNSLGGFVFKALDWVQIRDTLGNSDMANGSTQPLLLIAGRYDRRCGRRHDDVVPHDRRCGRRHDDVVPHDRRCGRRHDDVVPHDRRCGRRHDNVVPHDRRCGRRHDDVVPHDRRCGRRHDDVVPHNRRCGRRHDDVVPHDRRCGRRHDDVVPHDRRCGRRHDDVVPHDRRCGRRHDDVVPHRLMGCQKHTGLLLTAGHQNNEIWNLRNTWYSLIFWGNNFGSDALQGKPCAAQANKTWSCLNREWIFKAASNSFSPWGESTPKNRSRLGRACVQCIYLKQKSPSPFQNPPLVQPKHWCGAHDAPVQKPSMRLLARHIILLWIGGLWALLISSKRLAVSWNRAWASSMVTTPIEVKSLM